MNSPARSAGGRYDRWDAALPGHSCAYLRRSSARGALGVSLRCTLVASAGAAGCWVQCRLRRAPPPLALLCLRRFLVAVLRILGVRSTPSSPSFVGACAPEIPLRRSFLAYFLRGFSRPCPTGRRASVGRRASKLASNQKTTVSLAVAGLGLAGSVDAGCSVRRVTRKTNCPDEGAFPPTCPRWVERPALTCPTSVA